VAVVAAPDVEQHQALDHGAYTLLVFAVPLLLSAIFEAAVALISHAAPRRRVIAVALAVLSAALLLCACATTPLLLALGLGVAGAASGAACATAEAELVQRNPGALDQVMARWMLFGGLGDVLAPVVVATLFALGASYRAGFVVVLAFTLFESVSFFRSQAPDDGTASEIDSDDEEESIPLREALRLSLSDRRLWLWLFGCSLCTLLDELIAALIALRLRTELGATDAQAAACLTLYSAGIVVGAYITERAVTRWGWRRVLGVNGAGSAILLVCVVLSDSVVPLTSSLFFLGCMAAAHYPILLARAYESAPGRAAIVNAMTESFVLLDLALPPLLGALADRHGLGSALLCLLAQPVGVFLLAILGGKTERDSQRHSRQPYS
jgi:MFS transporter, FSR family, fosmidomycin resistance protein